MREYIYHVALFIGITIAVTLLFALSVFPQEWKLTTGILALIVIATLGILFISPMIDRRESWLRVFLELDTIKPLTFSLLTDQLGRIAIWATMLTVAKTFTTYYFSASSDAHFPYQTIIVCILVVYIYALTFIFISFMYSTIIKPAPPLLPRVIFIVCYGGLFLACTGAFTNLSLSSVDSLEKWLKKSTDSQKHTYQAVSRDNSDTIGKL
jgi:hypothetical protein